LDWDLNGAIDMEITNVSFHGGGKGNEDTMLQRVLLFWHGFYIPVSK
jgi:hypothetical protein